MKQLRYFDAVARNLHFGRAADAVAISQPALSMQIRDLELTLGVTLCERGKRGISLTPEGEGVARRVEHILSAVRDLKDYAECAGEELSGELRLGVIPSIAPYLLPDALAAIADRHPKLTIRLRESQTQNLINDLSAGQLDLLLLALPVNDPEIETIKLFDDPFYLAIRQDGTTARHGRDALKLLKMDELLLLEEGHCLRDQTLNFCGSVDEKSLTSFGASSLTTIMQMVANGHGMTLLPQLCADVEARDDRITLVRFPPPEPKRTIGLAWRRTSPRKREFVELGKVFYLDRNDEIMSA